MSKKEPYRRYAFGNEVILGTGTRFDLFLQQMQMGNIVYDPGIKMEYVSTSPKIKRRSQFRITSKNLPLLYEKNELVDVTAAEADTQMN